MNTLRILVTGSRDFVDEALVAAALGKLHRERGISVIVEGCARGADHLAEAFAEANGIAIEHHPADWSRYGRSAGMRRNQQMAEQAISAVVAFPANPAAISRGTAGMIGIARQRGIPVWIPRSI